MDVAEIFSFNALWHFSWKKSRGYDKGRIAFRFTPGNAHTQLRCCHEGPVIIGKQGVPALYSNLKSAMFFLVSPGSLSPAFMAPISITTRRSDCKRNLPYRLFWNEVKLGASCQAYMNNSPPILAFTVLHIASNLLLLNSRTLTSMTNNLKVAREKGTKAV